MVCSCGETFTTGSTSKELRIEICSKCHPFYSGQQKFVDTGGRVDKFTKKYQKYNDEKQRTKAEKASKAQEEAPAREDQREDVDTPQPLAEPGATGREDASRPDVPEEASRPEGHEHMVSPEGTLPSEEEISEEAVNEVNVQENLAEDSEKNAGESESSGETGSENSVKDSGSA